MPIRTIDYHRLALDDVQRAHRWYHRRSLWAAGRFDQQLRDAEASD